MMLCWVAAAARAGCSCARNGEAVRCAAESPSAPCAAVDPARIFGGGGEVKVKYSGGEVEVTISVKHRADSEPELVAQTRQLRLQGVAAQQQRFEEAQAAAAEVAPLPHLDMSMGAA